jgi:hypothetical protein
LELQEFADAAEDVSAPFHGCDNGAEIVISQYDP